MDDKTDIEMSIAKLKFLEDNAKYAVGQRVHTFINGKLHVGIIDDRRFDDNDNIYYDVRFAPNNIVTCKECLLIAVGTPMQNFSKSANSVSNFPF